MPPPEPHEPSDACHPFHCYSCMVDEFGPCYIACGECGHLYKTKGALRRAYRRSCWASSRHVINFPPAAPPVPKAPLFTVVRQVLTIRVKDIYFCPLCIHDF